MPLTYIINNQLDIITTKQSQNDISDDFVIADDISSALINKIIANDQQQNRDGELPR